MTVDIDPVFTAMRVFAKSGTVFIGCQCGQKLRVLDTMCYAPPRNNLKAEDGRCNVGNPCLLRL